MVKTIGWAICSSAIPQLTDYVLECILKWFSLLIMEHFFLWFTHLTLQPPAFLSSFSLRATVPVTLSHLQRTLPPLSGKDGRSKLVDVNKMVICWGEVRIPGQSRGESWVLLENPERSQWKHVSALHCWNNSIIFWHESICDSDSRSLGPHKEMECPCFATTGFTVTAIYPVELLDMQSF